jgi:hypothetical protein
MRQFLTFFLQLARKGALNTRKVRLQAPDGNPEFVRHPVYNNDDDVKGEGGRVGALGFEVASFRSRWVLIFSRSPILQLI